MSDVTVDSSFISQLGNPQQYLRVRDSSGRVVGFFLPADSAGSEIIFGVKSPNSPEELDRRYREEAKDARPLADFWKEMQQKYPEELS